MPPNTSDSTVMMCRDAMIKNGQHLRQSDQMWVLNGENRMKWTTTLFSLMCFLFQEKSVIAGMPSPRLIITELGRRRLEEISFFALGFLVTTVFVRFLWNGLAKDLPKLPRLTFRGALCLMLLWGLASPWIRSTC